MPLYPYRCTQCGHHFDKIQSFSAEPEVACPKCGGLLERTLTAPAFKFKGSGWYVNDYAGKNASTSAESSSTETNTPCGGSCGAACPAAATPTVS